MVKIEVCTVLIYYSQTVTLSLALQDKQSCHIAEASQIQSRAVCAIDQQRSITVLGQSKQKGLNFAYMNAASFFLISDNYHKAESNSEGGKK